MYRLKPATHSGYKTHGEWVKQMYSVPRDGGTKIKFGNFEVDSLTRSEYSSLMAWVMRRLASCDVCGCEWRAKDGEYPKQCPNRECRSRRWNGVRDAKPEGSDNGSVQRVGKVLAATDKVETVLVENARSVGPITLVNQKCWCGAEVYLWKNETTAVMKRKCFGTPSHTTALQKDEANG